MVLDLLERKRKSDRKWTKILSILREMLTGRRRNKIMIGTIEQMLQDMKDGVYDFTKNGKCSSCGSCCSRYLPLSSKELKEIKRYVKKHRINPYVHTFPTAEPTLDMTCPFRDEENKICTIYQQRPKICRSFLCSNPKNDIWATKQEFHAKYRVVDMRKEIWEE